MLNSEFVPALDVDSKRLMVVLHGLGDSAAGFRMMPAMVREPTLNYLLVNAPDEYFGGYSWFDFEGDRRPGIQRSVRLLFELLDAQREQGFPTDQTVLFGFSQGCLLTLEVGCTYPHQLAGCIGISGWLQDAADLISRFSPNAATQRFMVTHGTLDPVLPFDRSREQVQLLQQAGIGIEWHEFEKVHTIEQEEWGLMREFINP
jgi:phospholipase/carboxylesterase